MTPLSTPRPRPVVVVITGLSGAGKSTALNALEDIGFFCVDNLPPALGHETVRLCEEGGMHRIALGIDVRVRAFIGAVGQVFTALAANGQRDLHVVFLDASDEALLRRFSETRRPHPLDAADALARRRGATGALVDELELERERLAPLRARATHVVDTTALSVHDLRRTILAQFGPAAGGALRMFTRIVSFGFKYGVPMDADLLFDVRFLQNPYFVADLKPLQGTDKEVAEFVLEQEEAKELLDKIEALVRFVVPRCEREGKSYLTIAIGCTGGRHRSVAIAEALGKRLGDAPEHPVRVVHRDVSRGGFSTPPTRGFAG